MVYVPRPVGQTLIGKLQAGLGGKLVFLGDSTGDITTSGITDKPPRLIALALAQAFPLVRVEMTTWVDGGSAYPATTVIQAGDGSHGTLFIYNCSVPSLGRPAYMLAPYSDAMWAAIQPDQIIISLGHNEASAAADPFWRDELLALTETILLLCPLTEVALLTQNPRTDGNAAIQAARRFMTINIGNLRGFPVIDTYRVFVNADGSTNTNLMFDTVHPNQAGYNLMFGEIWKQLRYSPFTQDSLGQERSSLLDFLSPTVPLLNADYSTFAPPAAPTSWTASGTAPVFSADAVNYEGPGASAVKMDSTGLGAITYIEQGITGNALRPYLGKVVVFAVREFIAVGQNANVGRIHIRTTGGSNTISLNSVAKTVGQGGFRWQLISGRVDPTAGTLTVRAYCENGTAGGIVTIARASLRVGVLPGDFR